MSIYKKNMVYDFIKQGDLVFDVGANVGHKSALFLKAGAKVVAFEPQTECIDALKKLDITIENVALSNHTGEDLIYKSDETTLSTLSEEFIEVSGSERFKTSTWDKSDIVMTDTLDNMIKKHGKPNFIKIDVEGYEKEVLGGLTTPIQMISIEFTPELLDNSLKCIELIEGLGGSLTYNYVSQENTDFQFKEWVTKEEIINFLSSVTDYVVEFGDIYIKNNETN